MFPASLIDFGPIGGGGGEGGGGAPDITLTTTGPLDRYGPLKMRAAQPTPRNFWISHPDFQSPEASFYGYSSANCLSRVFCVDCQEIPASTCASGKAEVTRRWPNDGGSARRRAQYLNSASRRRDAEGAAYFGERLPRGDCEYWWAVEYTCIPPLTLAPSLNASASSAEGKKKGAAARVHAPGLAAAVALVAFAADGRP